MGKLILNIKLLVACKRSLTVMAADRDLFFASTYVVENLK